MILTVRELVDHLGMNPNTEVVGASIMVRVLERLGAIKKVGSRPFVDENGKPTIGRPSALYEFPENVTFAFPTEPLEFVPKVKKEKVKKVKVAPTAVEVVESEVEEPAETVEESVVEVEEPAEAVAEAEEPDTVPVVVVGGEVDFSSDTDLLSQILRESA